MIRAEVIKSAADTLVEDIRDDVADQMCAPKFMEQWHAQAFGLALALSRAGVFSWPKWVETFSAVIRSEPQREGETSNSAYYRQWHTALEKILLSTGALDSDEINQVAEDWRKSYINTPHGSPIELRHGLAVPEDYDELVKHHHHHHHHGERVRPKPVVISLAK
jgi:nitrile hydratase accessory protein